MKRIGWAPVAIFMNENVMTGRIGDVDVTGDDLNELWTWVAGNPITEESYRADAEATFKPKVKCHECDR